MDLRQQRLGKQRSTAAHQSGRHHGQVFHGGNGHGDEGGRDGKIQPHAVQSIDVLAGRDTEQGRQIPEQVEDESCDERVGWVKAAAALPVFQRHSEHLIGQEKSKAGTPAQGERQYVTAEGEAV